MEQQSVFGAQRIYISKRSAIFRQFIFKSNRQAKAANILQKARRKACLFDLKIAVSALTNAAPAAFAAIAFISGVSAAVVITSATMLFGITGILQALALFLPHFIFYIFGYWALYELAYKRSEFRLGEQIGILFRIALIWAVGIGSEVLLAPLVVTKIFVA